MALMKVKGNLERLFDKNLNDLVRGIRNHKDDEGKYIAACLEEIKQELRQHNTAVKANAVQKLTYLQVFVVCNLKFHGKKFSQKNRLVCHLIFSRKHMNNAHFARPFSFTR